MPKFFLSAIILLCMPNLFAQEFSAVVTNQNHSPLYGVNVMSSNPLSYTTTDKNGRFILNLNKKANGFIRISFMGLKSLTLPFSVTDTALFKGDTIVLSPVVFLTQQITIIANRSPRLLMQMPASISVVSKPQFKFLAGKRVDEKLKFTSGVFVDRPFGIYGKSVVGLRSVVSNEPGRQLTLIDGVPINKSDGGGTNWNRIITSDIQRIEVLKGPGAAIYGNNAMGGVINIISRKMTNPAYHAEVNMELSSYNTYSANMNWRQRLGNEKKSFYYSIAAQGIKSKGFLTVPDSIRNETDTSVFLTQYGVNATMGYSFTPNSSLEYGYNYSNEERGQGTKIKLKDGAVARYGTNFHRLAYNYKKNALIINVKLFYQLENYRRDIEKMKKGDYSLIKVNSDREDYGLLLSFSDKWKKHRFGINTDYRKGKVFGVDNYQFSGDRVINQGQMDILNISFYDEWQYNTHFKSIIGLNYLWGYFSKGDFSIKNATSATNFMTKYQASLPQKNWTAMSPRFALQYDFNDQTNVYAVYSYGYRTPSLDDLTRFGFINIGYKKANPNLKPEHIENVEMGLRIERKIFSLQSDVYFSRGYNFMYYVSTGETMFGGRKRVYEKQNVGLVSLRGAEVNLDVDIAKYWKATINYSFNYSKIIRFKTRTDLENKRLSYSPIDMANMGIHFDNKKWYTALNIHYQGKMFLNEINTFEVKPLLSIDFVLEYTLYKNFGIRFSGQNLTNKVYMVSTDQHSLGRYLSLGVKYHL